MENLPQEQRKQRLIQSKPSEKGEIITYLSRMGDVLDDIAEGGKLVIFLIAVHSIVDSDKMDVMLREENFRIHPHLQIVTAKAGHILYDHPLHFSGLHIRDHALEACTVERGPGNAVINIELDIGIPSVHCVFLEDFFLRRDLSRVFSS